MDRSAFRRVSLAFEVPGFRRLWLHSLFNWTAWLIASLTQGWLILQLTNSPFWVGLGFALRGASLTVFSLPMGALADRVDRRRILLVTQSLAALSATAVALLALSGAARAWHILVYMVALGCASSAERPATAGLMVDMVGAERLLNASAFRFLGSSLTRILAGLAGGAVLQWLGVGPNFLLVSAVYVGSLACLAGLRTPAAIKSVVAPFGWSLVEGLRYAVRTRPVRSLLQLSLSTESFGFAYMSMFPVMARDVLKAGGLGLGYLNAMSGVGQLIATVLLASRGDVRNRVSLLITAVLGFGVSVALFGLSRWLLVSLALVVVVHTLGSAYDVSMFAVLSTSAAAQMRGRVLGLYFATVGFNDLGGLWVGGMAALLGAPLAVTATGTLAVAGALLSLSGVRENARSPGRGPSRDLT
jgi:MFS family permease